MAGMAVMLAMASCSRVGDRTRIAGTIDADGIDSVSIVVPELDIDTLVAVNGKAFTFEMPADVTVVGSIAAGNYSVQFIPDGTKINVTLAEKSSAVSAARHVQAAFSEIAEKSEAAQKELTDQITAIRNMADIEEEKASAMIDSVYNRISDEFVGYNMEMISHNTDNIVGLVALQNMNGMVEDAQLDSIIGTLSDRIRENRFVAGLKKGIEARMSTAEGKPFKDFTIEDSDGKSVSFSDYIGKGKYVLVDFWASWCGPCKGEIPNIRAVYDSYRGNDFNVLSVAVWDRPEDTKNAAKEHNITWSQIINAQTVPTEIYGIEGIPQIMLFGPDGTILKRDLRGSDIEKEVAKYVSKKR